MTVHDQLTRVRKTNRNIATISMLLDILPHLDPAMMHRDIMTYVVVFSCSDWAVGVV